jgi:ATP-dependent RNA helicase DDX51/DBP6
MIITSSSFKPLIVIHLINNQKISSALCFTKSVDSAHRLNKLIELFQEIYLKENNKKICSNLISKEYSSDLSQDERKKLLKNFKNGKIKMYVVIITKCIIIELTF